MDILIAWLIPTVLTCILVFLAMIAADVKKLLAMQRQEHTTSQSQPQSQQTEATRHI